MNEEIILQKETVVQDSIGNEIIEKVGRRVYCRIDSISSNEFFQAQQTGVRPEVRFVCWLADYNGEDSVVYNGIEFRIYRTFVESKTDFIELYAEKKVAE